MRHTARTRTLFLTLLCAILTKSVIAANQPPRFVLEDGQSEIVLRLREGPDTPVGMLVYRLRGTDLDNDALTFGLLGKVANEVLRIETAGSREANVYLNKELDRETEDEYSFIITLTDGKLGNGNFITQSLLVIVEDTNDNEPIFKPFPNTVTVKENSPPAILATVEATDRDEGSYGQVVYSLQEPEGETGFFAISTIGGRGVVRLVQPLDYETKPLHQLRILATDRANEGRINTATAALLIKVEDEEDQPPEFVFVRSVSRISEDVPPGTSIARVRAIDGDRGINNNITYSITNGNQYLFGINSRTGVIYASQSLDREDPNSSNGAYLLTITAKEESRKIRPQPSASVEVTILLLDVNDEAPRFHSPHYVAEINENAQVGVPLSFVGDAVPAVFDYDQGNNGTFRLSLEGDGGLFDITPSLGVNEVTFLLRVKDASALDYETVKELNFSIIAREVVQQYPKSSTASITVYIRDSNDNYPQFVRESYTATIPENAGAGTTVAWIQARDEDSGVYGTAGIRFTGLQGPVADKFQIDPLSGIVTIREGAGNDLDREQVNQYTLIVEARDNNGKGNRNTVQLNIQLEDVNDNAPFFFQGMYEAHVEENAAKFSFPVVVQAYDRDLNGTPNSQIRYAIVDGDLRGNFSLNPTTGQLDINQPLDFELLPLGDTPDANTLHGNLGNIRAINLTVRAYDMGTPSLSSYVTVMVYVQDVNDYAPVFSKASYTRTISEDTPSGASVLQVKAWDMDGSSPNNLITYRLQGGGQDKFFMDALTGILSVANGASLDPDAFEPRKTSYQLQVVALDGGLGGNQLYSTASVTVSISDVNNKAPIMQNPGTIEVSEDVAPGQVLTHIVATDMDERSALRYWIDDKASEGRSEEGIVVRDIDYNVSSRFDVNNVDGTVRVLRELDRERVETIKLVIKVEDTAASTSGQTATGTLTIVVEDVNDNDPRTKPFYRRNVPENSKRGTPVLTITAEDADKNRTIRYALEGPSELLELLHIDRDSGEILVSNKIDRERFAWINITARVTDSGVPPRSTYVPLYIQVIDENDNNPQFVNSVTNFTIRENVALGTRVGKVEAFDADTGDFGKITYLLDGRSTRGMFAINADTGVITVADRLDREQQNSYTVIVEAWDNFKFGYASGESRNAFQPVTITIADENDEIPKLESHSSCASITEFHDTRIPITSIKATDKDDPDTPNGRVIFSIDEGNDEGLFSISNIDHMSAKIFAVKPLKGKYGNYTLRIKAQDRGNPPNAALDDFYICILDFNDHAPRFISPEQNTTIKIPENATVGSAVITVKATDDDVGLNADVRYRLRQDPMGHWKSFAIDEFSGLMTLKLPLDRERQKIYELRVEARDRGTPTSLSSELDLTVYVKNVNDNEPQFLIDVFHVNFTEHRAPGLDQAQVPNTVDRDEIDDGSSYHEQACYYIVNGNEVELFRLDPVSHILTVTRELDRELQSEHVLIIKATESCFQPPSDIKAFEPADDSLLKIIVHVADINDNAPFFVKDNFTGGITTETNFGTEVVAVKAIDFDSGVNAQLSYYIKGPVHQTLTEGLETVQGMPFAINKSTGIISLNFDPQRDMKGYFDMQVVVNDTGGLSDTARVFIYLLREDQRVKFVLRQHPQHVRSRIDQFQDTMRNITRTIVNVDEFRVHANQDGSVDKTRTDVYMHFVDPNDNSILEADSALRLVDQNVETLDQLFREFNVLDTAPAERPKALESTTPMPLLWASGAAVFLVSMLLLLLGICIVQRARLLRKLRAATASSTSFGPTDTGLRRDGQVPNTNQHSTQGSNPIWRTDYESEWYKPDDFYARSSEIDGQDSIDENAVLDAAERMTQRQASFSTERTSSTNRESQKDVSRNSVLSARNLILQGLHRESISSSRNDSDEHTDSVAQVERERDVSEVREQNNINRRSNDGSLYQKNVYHFGYADMHAGLDKLANPLIPRRLETTEL